MADYSNILGLFNSQPNFNQRLPAWQSDTASQPIPFDPSQNTPLNFMQGISLPAPPQIDPMAQQAAPQAPVAMPDGRSLRERHSALDVIGKIADSLAVAGGHTGGWQAGIDADLQRRQASQDRPGQIQLADLQRQHLQQQIASGATDMTKDQAETANTLNKVNAGRYGAALRGLQAIVKANPQADLASTWAAFAKQNQIPDADAQALFGIIQKNPGSIDGLASQYEKAHTGGGAGEYGLQPFIVTDGQGNTRAYQLSKTGGMQEITPPAGFHPATQMMQTDAGGNIVISDKRTGLPQRIIPKTVAPDTAASQAGQDRRQQAGFEHADAKTAATGDASKARQALQDLSAGFDSLHALGALPGEGNILTGALSRTRAGQYMGEQAGTPAAQKRAEMTKNIAILQQELIKGLPGSATRTKFEQEQLLKSLPDPTRMSYQTAQNVIRQLRETLFKAATPPAARPVLSAKPAAPKAPASKVTVSGW